MTTDLTAPAPPSTSGALQTTSDPRPLERLLSVVAEDTAFVLSCGGGTSTLDDFGKRRSPAYAEILAGHAVNDMRTAFDAWHLDLTRAMAPIHPHALLPMSDLLAERVTLEGGPRGLRSLFSSKPSEKDVVRVKRLGTLGTRVLRAVFASDGPLNPEETHLLSAFIVSLGLPDDVTNELRNEATIPVEQLDVYGDVEPVVAKALVRGAWLAAAADGIDGREELIVRVLANKLSISAMDMDVLRKEIQERIEDRRIEGLAAIDAIRVVMSDRVPGLGTELATKVAIFALPQCHRAEGFANLSAGETATMSKRGKLGDDARKRVLGISWALAMHDDPSLTRRAVLRARHDRVADALGEDGARVRHAVDEWMNAVLTPAAETQTSAKTSEK